jgi:peptidoglycan/LPS O-acetylase OafA/YrhL
VRVGGWSLDGHGHNMRTVDSFNRQLDRLVERTPEDRERYVDFLRAAAIVVVIIWHWVLSITHRTADGRLVMPNPIEHIPGAWLATWVLQVMTVFFIVGGFANHAGWRAVRRDGGGAAAFYGKRLKRLLVPVAVFLAFWAVLEMVLHLVVDGYRGVHQYGMVNFIPLWFLAAYLWVVLLVPLTARAHDRFRELAVVTLGAGVVLADLFRFAYEIEAFRYANSALVWVFVHQLGYFYADGTFDRAAPRRSVALLLSGIVALVVLTTLPAYPRSMVATGAEEASNMFPTTAAIGALAVVQLGILLLVRGPVSRWLERRRPWKTVVGVNAVIMTIFVWHMTALLAAIWVFERFGVPLLGEPTAAWWAQRPLWLVVPGLFLLALTALFNRFERI